MSVFDAGHQLAWVSKAGQIAECGEHPDRRGELHVALRLQAKDGWMEAPVDDCLAQRSLEPLASSLAPTHARARSRNASSSTLGTYTADRSPARSDRASFTASRRSVLMHSPGFPGINDGAPTMHS
ncbi:hypothetical protein G3N94_03555 [Burkholderia sp. Ac-20353]|nr:hypothetical protein [Burkholderia sp. Ac-20353]